MTHAAAGIGSLHTGQVANTGLEHVHFLHQAAQGSFSGLTNLLIDLLRLWSEHTHKT